MRGAAPRKLPVVVIWPNKLTVDVGGAVGVRGLRELGMIQGVEVLHAKFQFDALGDGSGFSESNVEIGQARTAEQVAMQTVGAVSRVVHGIELREAWVRRLRSRRCSAGEDWKNCWDRR